MSTILPVDDDLGVPRPGAWGYVQPPGFYPHAEGQWRSRLETLAAEEGFTIVRWFGDYDGRTDGLYAMWTMLRESGVRALFVPDPSHLRLLPNFRGLAVQEIRDQLPVQLFVLSETFAAIVPPEPQLNIVREERTTPARRGRRWWCHLGPS